MKVLICGIDGYIGWPLALQRFMKGDEVVGVDNFSRREKVSGVGGESLTPIGSKEDRRSTLRELGVEFNVLDMDIMRYQALEHIFMSHEFDAIVHLAEQPSAPYSMRGPMEAVETQCQNVESTLLLLHLMKKYCPEAHLVKLGTMGEYGTPNCDIPEGEISKECRVPADGAWRDVECPMAGLLFPRDPGSWYHLSKVHDTYNIRFACKVWDLRSTDIMQGVVFGVSTPGTDESCEYITRFDYDQYFGTVINRFCAQAISGHPITPYGTGGQTRGYLPLADSLQCIGIILDNPPKKGKYRTVNQFQETYSVNHLARVVAEEAREMELNVEIQNISNPRVEQESHEYEPEHRWLLEHGYEPIIEVREGIRQLLTKILPYKNYVKPSGINPTTTWR